MQLVAPLSMARKLTVKTVAQVKPTGEIKKRVVSRSAITFAVFAASEAARVSH